MLPNNQLYNIENSKKFFVRILKKYKVYQRFKDYIKKNRKLICGGDLTFIQTLVTHLWYDKSQQCLFNALEEAKYTSQVDLKMFLCLGLQCDEYTVHCILRQIEIYKALHKY